MGCTCRQYDGDDTSVKSKIQHGKERGFPGVC